MKASLKRFIERHCTLNSNVTHHRGTVKGRLGGLPAGFFVADVTQKRKVWASIEDKTVIVWYFHKEVEITVHDSMATFGRALAQLGN